MLLTWLINHMILRIEGMNIQNTWSLLSEVKFSDSVAHWTDDTISISSEADVTFTINRTEEVGELCKERKIMLARIILSGKNFICHHTVSWYSNEEKYKNI